MRSLPFLALLLASAILAGCSSPDATESDAAAAPDDGDGGRTARPGRGSEYAGNETDLRAVVILQAPLQMAGAGPESFDVEVPADVAAVGYRFANSPTFQAAGLRVELSGCGAYDNGMGFMGSTGGDYWGELCGTAEPGRQSVTVSGDLVVFDGVFSVTAYVPANGTATASS